MQRQYGAQTLFYVSHPRAPTEIALMMVAGKLTDLSLYGWDAQPHHWRRRPKCVGIVICILLRLCIKAIIYRHIKTKRPRATQFPVLRSPRAFCWLSSELMQHFLHWKGTCAYIFRLACGINIFIYHMLDQKHLFELKMQKTWEILNFRSKFLQVIKLYVYKFTER